MEKHTDAYSDVIVKWFIFIQLHHFLHFPPDTQLKAGEKIRALGGKADNHLVNQYSGWLNIV